MQKQAQFWKTLAVTTSLIGFGTISAAPNAHAQGATFPDVPSNHWAYQAVGDLAEKGYVKGYPDGKFLGKRALTRYEFATVIDRMAQTITDLSAQAKAGQAVATPTGVPVTQDDLNKINALVDGFQKQLSDIQSVTAGATSPFQDQLDAVRADLLDIQANVAKAQAAADGSYGFGATRKFQITGYIQARYTEAGKARGLYPQGSSAISGGYNGNYSQGGNNESFEVRRARLKFTGAVTPNTKFAVQIDTSGAITAGTTPNQQVTVREGNVAYTFGDGSAKYPTVTAGLFATPFGYALPLSQANNVIPERPLAFSEASYGIFNSEDYDKGAQLTYGLNGGAFKRTPVALTAALINGNGRTGEATTRQISQIYRAAYLSPSKVVGVGVSYFDGQIPTGTVVGTTYQARHKQLYGADAQVILPTGPFLLGEYVGGKFEQRTAFAFAPGTGYGLTPATAFAAGNKIEGYYVQGGYTFGYTSPRPLSLFVSYDVLRRAEGSAGSSSSYTDENTGYGASLNLDKQTRFRLYYVRPNKVAHTPNGPDPLKIGQTIGELQVKF